MTLIYIIGYIIGFLITYIIFKFKIIDAEDKDNNDLKHTWGGVLFKFVLGLFWPLTLVVTIIAFIFIGIDEILENDPPKWL